MELLDLLAAVKPLVEGGYVRWDADENGEIRLYTGLTMRDETGKVDPNTTLRPTAANVAFNEMGK